LFVVFDRLYFAHVRRFWIETRPSFRPALAKQIPALVQIFFDLTPSRSLGFAGTSSLFLFEEFVFLILQPAYPVKDVLIFHMDSSSSCAHLASRLSSRRNSPSRS